MNLPLISIVLPICDAADTLPAALASLQAQTETDFEVLALDHGSIDGSGDIAAAWAVGRLPIRLIRLPRAAAFADVLNRGVAEARGAWIARMDADDVSHPERFRTQLEFARVNPDIEVVSCRVAFGGDRVARAGYARYVDWINELLSHDEMALARFRESPLAHPSVLIRRAVFERYGGYRAGPFPEDYELWLRWFEAGVRFGKCPDELLVWNDSPGRLSRTDPRYALEAFYELKAAYLARWLEQHNPHHPDIIVIGAGRVTRRRVELLMRHGIRVRAWADLDPAKQGRRYHGAPVVRHEDLPAPGAAFIVPYVSAIGAPEYIRAMLEARGHICGRDFIEAA